MQKRYLVVFVSQDLAITARGKWIEEDEGENDAEYYVITEDSIE